MNFRIVLIVVLASVVAGGCGLTGDSQGITLTTEVFDFSGSTNGWIPGFSDYPASREDSARFELVHEYKFVDGIGNAMMLSGNNNNADLFMFLKRKTSGLRPLTEYTVSFEVELACSSKDASVGTGYGSQVYLKVGAAEMEPKSVIDQGKFEMNIDKGQHDDGGADMRFVGTLTAPTYSFAPYTTINLNNSAIDNPFTVKTNSRGELWLIVGTDSDYQGAISLYYTRITVVISTSK